MKGTTLERSVLYQPGINTSWLIRHSGGEQHSLRCTYDTLRHRESDSHKVIGILATISMTLVGLQDLQMAGEDIGLKHSG